MATTGEAKAEPMGPEAVKILKDHGWDKGFVYFGSPAGNPVKVETAIHLLMKQPNFKHQVTWVNVKVFDATPLQTKNGETIMGSASDEWVALSNGKGYLPGVAIDGVMYMDGWNILKLLTLLFPSTSLSDSEWAEVVEWVDLDAKYNEYLMETLVTFSKFPPVPSKSGLLSNNGYGKHDLTWEKERVRITDEYFKMLNAALGRKPGGINGYIVGDTLTIADCAHISYCWILYLGARLDVPRRYPKVYENMLKLKEKCPTGAEEFHKVWKIVRVLVSIFSAYDRSSACFMCCGHDHYIEHPKLWK